MKPKKDVLVKERGHYWICGLTGLLAGFLAFFICTHNFEFFWPFNLPIKVTMVESVPITIISEIRPTESQTSSDYIVCDSLGKIEVGMKVKAKNDGTGQIRIGYVESIYPNSEFPLLVLEDDADGNTKFDPAYMGDSLKGKNWERYQCLEIVKVLGK